MNRFELHIEELVLHGFAPGDRYRLGEAVERELLRLFAERGAPPWLSRGGQVDRLDAGLLSAMPGAGPGVLGAQVAQAVYAALTRPPGPMDARPPQDTDVGAPGQ